MKLRIEGEYTCVVNEDGTYFPLFKIAPIDIGYVEEIITVFNSHARGLSVMLPCEVGSTVYGVRNTGTKKKPCYEIEECIVDSYIVGEQLSMYIYSKESGQMELVGMYDIGKTIFLTKEEVESKIN